MNARAAWSIPGFETERATGTRAEIWCYTDRFSYRTGERVEVHVHTTAPTYDVRVIRDGANPALVWSLDDQPGHAHETAANAYETGCGWPVEFVIDIADDWSSGLYLVVVGFERGDQRVEREHFFVLRSRRPAAPYALVLTTSTMIAYNDWGGANHYRGADDGEAPAPVLSTQRPIGRGMLRKPDTAPRNANPETPGPDYQPSHPVYEWALANGYSRHHSDAFWATYERPFVVWAEQRGYSFDYLTQQDLHEDPGALDGYQCAVIVGHDEYWTWEMRDCIDGYLERGGNLARFAGNFLWQVRLENDATIQVCYKDPRIDPLMTLSPQRVTTAWDAPFIDRPGAATMGLTGMAGVYNRYGATTPRSSGGYTVHRPRHWVFEGTDLYYGDIFGAAPICIASFELDAVDYTVRKGLPFPTFSDGAPEDLEILAMAPAVAGEIDCWGGGVPIGAPLEEFEGLLGAIWGDEIPERFQGEHYGAGMMATCTRGRGAIFNAGTTEWVSGLLHGDPFAEQITHNVLRRFASSV